MKTRKKTAKNADFSRGDFPGRDSPPKAAPDSSEKAWIYQRIRPNPRKTPESRENASQTAKNTENTSKNAEHTTKTLTPPPAPSPSSWTNYSDVVWEGLERSRPIFGQICHHFAPRRRGSKYLGGPRRFDAILGPGISRYVTGTRDFPVRYSDQGFPGTLLGPGISQRFSRYSQRFSLIFTRFSRIFIPKYPQNARIIPRTP